MQAREDKGLNENDSISHREKGKYSRYDSSIFANSYISLLNFLFH